MEIKSNGYFKKRDFDIDTSEEIYINDLEDNGDIVANIMLWGYNDLINGLKILPKDLTEEQNGTILYNCYIDFSRSEKFWFVINFYDFDEKILDKDIAEKIKEINYEIKLEINTKEEIEIFKNKVNEFLERIGYNNIEEFFKENL